MRADRLIAALLVLQRRGRVTARQLADELEVSVATARRDLEALAMAGVPVYPQPGRGGGWSLIGGARTDLTGLSEHEVHALFTAAGPALTGTARAQVAVRKLVQALPETYRRLAEAASEATIVDAAAWGHLADERPPLVGALEAAVVHRRRVRLSYTSGSGRVSERVVEPTGIVAKDGTWYLLAGTDDGRRTFRVDRIADAIDTGERFDRADGPSLAALWDAVVGDVEEMRSLTRATLVIDERFVFVLRDQFGRHCVTESIEDGRARVQVAAPTTLDLARTLAGWGDAVEVLHPPELRARLGRIGQQLATLYRADVAEHG